MGNGVSSGKGAKPSQKTPGGEREARLKAALKANMAKRKAQARKRAESSEKPDPEKDPGNI